MFVALGGGRPLVRPWLLLELGGLSVLVLGITGVRYGYRVSGVVAAGVGIVVCVVALGGFALGADELIQQVRYFPGLVGLGLLVGAIAPIRGQGSRLLVKVGTGGLFLCVVFTGLFREADTTLLLLTGAGTILAWDGGDYAIGVGEQLGRQAQTWRLELTHLLASALVGGVAVASVILAQRVADTQLSLASFVLTFVAALLLLGALRR
ncbi:DUF7519 family protein [Halorientalis salina]|uniref:DUF7519 family protein n=1 Tax=Halorientalis salina TaxID=2932266 RepID=UPI0010AD6B09|nr:hypothetical protein [Halorientalis salina]